MSGIRPAVLVILDGYGFNPSGFGNAIAAARKPNIDALMERWPHTLVDASGEAVGLPAGQQGNSEVGHLTIGSGRVVDQPLLRINRAVRDGSLFENAVLAEALESAAKRGATVHLVGLVSPGGVHSHQDHALAVCELARRKGVERVAVHVVTDGRDEPPSSAAGFVRTFAEGLAKAGVGEIASVSGRYYTMDRDRRWDRTALAYEVLAGDGGPCAPDAVGYIEGEYAAGRTDEFILPASIVPEGGERRRIEDGDTVIFFNFRPDRMRQITHALTDSGFDGFERSRVPRDLDCVTFTEYARDLKVRVAFPRQDVTGTLAEVVSRAGLRQFHTAETEKYAHVTYFVNGGREDAFDGEERKLIPSQKVATYDTVPEMSAPAITDAVVEHLQSGGDGLVIVNYANPDMVGHTGVFPATVAAVEVVDGCIGRVAEATFAAGGALLITADHGNAELKVDARDNSPLTAHTTSPVPVLVGGTDARALREGGGLCDVAPTLLDVMGLEQPPEMTGRSLVER